MNYNRLTIGGYLAREPELKHLPSNTALVEFCIGTTRTWRDAGGNKKTETAFVDCVAFGKQAENINQFFTKGKPILIDGYLRQDKWETKEGQKRSKLVVVCDRFYFVGGDKTATASAPAKQSERYEGDGSSEAAPDYDQHNPDDIPF